MLPTAPHVLPTCPAPALNRRPACRPACRLAQDQSIRVWKFDPAKNAFECTAVLQVGGGVAHRALRAWQRK